MGFLSDLFGGKDNSAQKATNQLNREVMAYTKEQAEKARGDALRLYPQASQDRRAGYASALDILANIIPQQFGVIQQGRQNVQDTLLRGQSQSINALLGRPVNMAGMMKGPLSVDTRFARQSLPESQQADEPPVYDIRQFLGGVR